jgi:hypothetical protein
MHVFESKSAREKGAPHTNKKKSMIVVASYKSDTITSATSKIKMVAWLFSAGVANILVQQDANG